MRTYKKQFLSQIIIGVGICPSAMWAEARNAKIPAEAGATAMIPVIFYLDFPIFSAHLRFSAVTYSFKYDWTNHVVCIGNGVTRHGVIIISTTM
jgi:hypothetical protein